MQHFTRRKHTMKEMQQVQTPKGAVQCSIIKVTGVYSHETSAQSNEYK